MEFQVEYKKRGKLYNIKKGLKFEDMVQMVHEDFGIDRLGNDLERLNYEFWWYNANASLYKIV